MAVLDFMHTYILLLLVGSLAITGWFVITRGREEINPDGSITRKGKIFKGWFFFWTQKKNGPPHRIYYSGDQLKLLINQYFLHYPNNPHALTYDPNFSEISIGINTPVPNHPRTIEEIKADQRYAINKIQKDIDRIEAKLNVKVDIIEEHNAIRFYKEYDRYVFPEFLRFMLATCPTCFSSFYGSLFYWGAMYFIGDQMYAPFGSMAYFCASFFWVVFCLSLTVLNTFIANRVN